MAKGAQEVADSSGKKVLFFFFASSFTIPCVCLRYSSEEVALRDEAEKRRKLPSFSQNNNCYLLVITLGRFVFLFFEFENCDSRRSQL